jgi:CheY-specific phosphatase CheX
MSSAAEKILYRKAALIFEELGFMMPQSDNGQELPINSLCACVSFDGPFKGCLLVLLSPEALSMLSSNMLGRSYSQDEMVEQDALREIANVICGNSLPTIFEVKEPFRMESPKIFANSDSLTIEPDFSRIAQIGVPFDCGQSDIILYAESKAVSSLDAGRKLA